MLMAALAEHLEKTGYVGAVVLAALNPELGGSIETVRCVNFCLTTNTILTTIQSLFMMLTEMTLGICLDCCCSKKGSFRRLVNLLGKFIVSTLFILRLNGSLLSI